MNRAVFRFSCLAFSMLLMLTQAMTAQWTEVKLPRPNPQTSLVSVEWPDSSTGYVFDARGVYYKTTDEGTTWSVDSLQPPAGFTLRYADFITPKFGIASFQFIDGLDSLIYYTSDGGATWTSRLIPLPNASVWGSSNMPYSRIRLLGPNRWFLHYMMEDLVLWYGAERTLYSSDQGMSWKLLGVDTLREGDLSAMCYIVIDSLHQYKFYVENLWDTINSWVRTTTDGGKSWWRIRNPNNPLAEQYYAGMAFGNIHMVNDTGIAMRAGPANKWPPGRDYGLVTKDIRFINRFEGWESFALPWFGSTTRDVTYQDGILYAETVSPARVGGDSVWIRQQPALIARGFNSPDIWELSNSSRNILWGLTKPGSWNNKLYRFDRQLVPVEETNPRPAGEGMRVHPNPMHGNSEMTLTYELVDHVGEATIGIYDILGRRVLSISLGERNRGAHRESINLASSAIASACGLYVIVLSTPYRVLSTTTVMFY